MRTFMLRLDGVLQRRRRLVLGLWAAALVAALPLAANESKHLTGGGFNAPDSPSDQVQAAIARGDYPGAPNGLLAVVVVPRQDARPGDRARAVGNVYREVAKVHGVERLRPTPDAARSAGPRSDRPVVIPLNVPGGQMRAIDVGKDLRERLGISGDRAGDAQGGRVRLHVVGQGALWQAAQERGKDEAAHAEARAFPLIAVVLLAAFGSVAATALPLGLGFVALVVSAGLIYLLSLVSQTSVLVTNVTSLLGIGVAIDYSLFVVARYREEIRAGRTADQARAVALSTSGVAVVFSGLTVVVAMAALFLIGSTALETVAIGAMLVVASAVLVASTLLPVAIALLGRRAHEPGRLNRVLRRRGAREHDGDGGFWIRWTATVMRRPALSFLVGTTVLLVLAAPALDLHIGNSFLRQLPADSEFRQGAQAAASVAGAGALSPVLVDASIERGTFGDRANQVAIRRLVAATRRDPEVERVLPPRPSRDGRSALVTAVLRHDPEAQQARDAVKRLRDRLPAVAGRAANVKLGGTTAVILDFDELVSGSMWMLILFVLTLSFVVLVVLLRSIVLPLKAVLMNVLSVAAAYGVVVAVFQWGWLEFLGLSKAPFVDTITPPLVLVFAFGLSMDYEVFLLSRIRDRYARTGDTNRAVAEGLATSAGTITSAAMIMVVVFIAFVTAGSETIQRLGLACAVAIAVDATIARLVLVPALMRLLGRWNWWFPKWLGRLLPTVGVEEVAVEPAPSGGRLHRPAPDGAGGDARPRPPPS